MLLAEQLGVKTGALNEIGSPQGKTVGETTTKHDDLPEEWVHDLWVELLGRFPSLFRSKKRDINTGVLRPVNHYEARVELLQINRDTWQNEGYRINNPDNRAFMAKYLKEFSNLRVIAPVTDGIARPTEVDLVVNEKRPFVGMQRRAVVDGRQANANTKEFKFLLPDLEDIRRQLAGKRYYADLNLSKAFHQIPLAKECQYLTTFVANDRLYYYKRVTMGMKQSAGHMQAALTATLALS